MESGHLLSTPHYLKGPIFINHYGPSGDGAPIYVFTQEFHGLGNIRMVMHIGITQQGKKNELSGCSSEVVFVVKCVCCNVGPAAMMKLSVLVMLRDEY